MSSSTSMTNTDKHQSSPPPTYHGHSQPRRHPAAMRKWLEEIPQDEPWTSCSHMCERHSSSDAQIIRKELQDFAKRVPRGTDYNRNRSADMAGTAKPLLSTRLAHNKRPQSQQPRSAAMQKWLEETPHEEPWSTSSRTIEKCSVSEIQDPLTSSNKIWHGI
jgi:hypothetical protein